MLPLSDCFWRNVAIVRNIKESKQTKTSDGRGAVRKLELLSGSVLLIAISVTSYVDAVRVQTEFTWNLLRDFDSFEARNLVLLMEIALFFFNGCNPHA